jgi:uncharacterized protein YcgI (DUF1989 family)
MPTIDSKRTYSSPKFDVVDMQFYGRLAQEQQSRVLVRELVVPAKSGKACVVDKGHILRIACIEGPQVADFNAFYKDDPKEMFWSGRTRLLHRAHLSVGARLWSTPPRMRPMFTIIADTVRHQPLYRNARSHDLMYCRCNERLGEVAVGTKRVLNCNTNLANAIADFGLTEDYVHDAFNIFMTAGLDENDRFFFVEPDAVKGDYVELYAEIDCIVAISACPGVSSGATNHPLGLQIYRPHLNGN